MSRETGSRAWALSLVMLVTGASHAAEINFSSATDFTRMELLLKDNKELNPAYLSMDVTLSPQTAKRVQDISRASIGQQLTLSINGWQISTVTVHSVMGPRARLIIPKAIAKDLLPTLID